MSKQNKGLVPELRFPEFRNDESWKALTLSELSTRITEKVGTKKLTTVSITAGVGFVTQAEKFSRDISGKQYKNYIHLRKGDYSYNKGNSKTFPQGCIYKLQEFDEAAAPNAFISFRFKKNYVGDFFRGYFDSNYHGRQLTRFITSGARSDGLLNISPADFLSVAFPTPTSNSEQQKIADCLASIDELITLYTQKLDSLKDHKKGLMQQLFPTEGEAAPKLRFPEFKEDGKWCKVTLGRLGELVSGLTYSPADVCEEGLLVLRSSNVQSGQISLEDNVFVKPYIKGVNYSKPGDILICVRNGSKSLIGKNALIPERLPMCTHGAFMTVFRSNRSKFIYQLFQTHAYERQVAADLGATINSINGNQLKKYEFYVPKSEKEQDAIADILSSIDAMISAHSVQIDKLKNHKKGLIQKLFPIMDDVTL